MTTVTFSEKLYLGGGYYFAPAIYIKNNTKIHITFLYQKILRDRCKNSNSK
jgi:hypothetical protein